MSNKILYFHNGYSTFVKKDIEIYKSNYEVLEFYFIVKNKKRLAIQFIKQFIFLLKYRKTQLFITQFGGFHSFLPMLFSKIFRKKHIIILSGTDCVSFPSIDYGNFNRFFLSKFTSVSLKNASLLLPVSQELVKYKYTYQDNDYPFQGYEFHIKNIKTPFKVVHYGYDSDKWSSSYPKEKNSFVTIASDLSSRFGVQLKGIDLIIDIANYFPEFCFYIVGGSKINNKSNFPNNIKLLDLMPHEKLSKFLSNKQFYLQLSMSEGFPNALCEAMLCNCVPIVSNVSSMPFIIGDSGFILEKKNKFILKELIEKITKIENIESYQNKARARIEENFSLELRKNKLLKIVDELLLI